MATMIYCNVLLCLVELCLNFSCNVLAECLADVRDAACCVHDVDIATCLAYSLDCFNEFVSDRTNLVLLKLAESLLVVLSRLLYLLIH